MLYVLFHAAKCTFCYVLLLFSFCLRANEEKSNSFDVLFCFSNDIITARPAIGLGDELIFFSFHFIFFAFVIPLFPFSFCVFVFFTLRFFMENSLLSCSFIIFAVVIFLFSKKKYLFSWACVCCVFEPVNEH